MSRWRKRARRCSRSASGVMARARSLAVARRICAPRCRRWLPASFASVVRGGNEIRGMPKFEELSDRELEALRHYIRARARKVTRPDGVAPPEPEAPAASRAASEGAEFQRPSHLRARWSRPASASAAVNLSGRGAGQASREGSLVKRLSVMGIETNSRIAVDFQLAAFTDEQRQADSSIFAPRFSHVTHWHAGQRQERTHLWIGRIRHHHGVPGPLQSAHPSRQAAHAERGIPGAADAPRVRRLRGQHRLQPEAARRVPVIRWAASAWTSRRTPSG